MARWKLRCAHYLRVSGNMWEQKEIDRASGKEVRKQYEVPALFDTNDPSHWNEVFRGANGQVVDGEIHVSDGVNPGPRDIIFIGDPTPDMEPMDADAEAKSAKFAKLWNHPIDSLPGTFSESLLIGLQAQLADAQTKHGEARVAGMDDLLVAIRSMAENNAALIAAIGGQHAKQNVEAGSDDGGSGARSEVREAGGDPSRRRA